MHRGSVSTFCHINATNPIQIRIKMEKIKHFIFERKEIWNKNASISKYLTLGSCVIPSNARMNELKQRSIENQSAERMEWKKEKSEISLK